MTKPISCGIVLTDFKEMLVCHPTNEDDHCWSVPKGLIDEGENYEQTARRELQEETSIICPDKLILLGKYFYRMDKDLVFFLAEVAELPSIEQCVCSSFFEENGIKVPEIDDFKYIRFSEAEITAWLNDNQARALLNALKKHGYL